MQYVHVLPYPEKQKPRQVAGHVLSLTAFISHEHYSEA